MPANNNINLLNSKYRRKNFCVLCANDIEKSIVLATLGGAFNVEISNNIVNKINAKEFPYVWVEDGEIKCLSYSSGVLIEFKDLSKIFDKSNVFVNLNDDYLAEVKSDVVVVGCQRFSFEAIEELYKAVTEVRERNKK